jgi:hypothetical protein
MPSMSTSPERQMSLAQKYRGVFSPFPPAYQGFLTIWKDADRDIPMLKQAKAEYAKLQ